METIKKMTWRHFVLIAVGLSLALNCLTLYWLYRLDKHLDIPVSVHASCSGGSAVRELSEGIRNGRISVEVAPELDLEGRVQLLADFQLIEKIPGAVVLFRFRDYLGDGVYGDWNALIPEEAEPLHYHFSLAIENKKQAIQYQVVQQLNGENIKASSLNRYRYGYGNGDVEFYYSQYINDNKVTFKFRQDYTPIKDLQIGKIDLTVVKGDKEENYILSGYEDNLEQLQCEVKERDKIDIIKIRVVYKDGEERTAEITTNYESYPRPLIER